MSAPQLTKLGMTVREAQGRLEAELELSHVRLVNPSSQTTIERVTFTAVGDRLIALDPPELLGVEPIRASSFQSAQELEEKLATLFAESVRHLERRSAELSQLGLQPNVDPQTMRLTATVSAGGLSFTVAADRRGNFRVVRAVKGGASLELPEAQAFELSEFHERGALAGYLAALVGEQLPTDGAGGAVAEKAAAVVALSEILERFGPGAVLPPKSSLEFLVELRVGGTPYRFAAGRVIGRTFRGLLAGASGKVWADRFELEEFGGVAALVARVLGVRANQVEILNAKKGS